MCAFYWTFSFKIFDYKGTLNNVPPEALGASNTVGLDVEALVLSPAKIPYLGCFGDVETMVSGGDVSGSECDPNLLFPRFNKLPSSSGGPWPCLWQLCSPSGILNPGIGGIGVSQSRLILLKAQLMSGTLKDLRFVGYAEQYCRPSLRCNYRAGPVVVPGVGPARQPE